MSKLFKKYEAIILNGEIKEGEILGLKKALNNYAKTSLTKDERRELESMIYDACGGDGLALNQEQNQKGIKWLLNEWKTPRGVERKNSPFGYREENVLENFSHFTLRYMHDLANYYQSQNDLHNYVPVYGVWGKDGSYFEYYVQKGTGYNGGSVSIIG